jgi:hypothetical protein
MNKNFLENRIMKFWEIDEHTLETYKKDVDDVRESGALDIAHLLIEKGASLAYFDPYVPKCRVNGSQFESLDMNQIDDCIEKADCVVITTDHSIMDYGEILVQSKLLIDTKNAVRRSGSLWPPVAESGHCVLYKYHHEQLGVDLSHMGTFHIQSETSLQQVGCQR